MLTKTPQLQIQNITQVLNTRIRQCLLEEAKYTKYFELFTSIQINKIRLKDEGIVKHGQVLHTANLYKKTNKIENNITSKNVRDASMKRTGHVGSFKSNRASFAARQRRGEGLKTDRYTVLK